MRRKAVIDRLINEKERLMQDNPQLKFYERQKGLLFNVKPQDIDTAGYWRLNDRKVKANAKPIAYVVSGRGGTRNGTKFLTHFVAAYHITQTEII